ncbi:unnamed protein product [Schistosoma mattheei]|uniref:Uncharacterized protein n=1 Tax=Schistosoma mattheei TaxID=31246 RepID=A0AA85ATK4_9TREM|nr:unnamed protein product [Schistosoma mattheei]
MMKKNRCICGYCPHGVLACDQNFMQRYQHGMTGGYGPGGQNIGGGYHKHNPLYPNPMTPQYPPAQPFNAMQQASMMPQQPAVCPNPGSHQTGYFPQPGMPQQNYGPGHHGNQPYPS